MNDFECYKLDSDPALAAQPVDCIVLVNQPLQQKESTPVDTMMAVGPFVFIAMCATAAVAAAKPIWKR